jgi:hypothetical protein
MEYINLGMDGVSLVVGLGTDGVYHWWLVWEASKISCSQWKLIIPAGADSELTSPLGQNSATPNFQSAQWKSAISAPGGAVPGAQILPILTVHPWTAASNEARLTRVLVLDDTYRQWSINFLCMINLDTGRGWHRLIPAATLLSLPRLLHLFRDFFCE